MALSHGLRFQFRRACCRTIVGSRSGERAVALTFDDGPDPATTPAILAALAEHDAPATFFLLGRQVAAYPELTRDIARAGHVIGNHAYSHASLPGLSLSAVWRELHDTARILARTTGRTPALFRPPFGDELSPTHLLARAMGYRVVHWSASGDDWRGDPATTIAERVCAQVHPGAIVLLHDGQPATPTALDAILKDLHARAFDLVTLPQLFRRGPLQHRLWPEPEARV